MVTRDRLNRLDSFCSRTCRQMLFIGWVVFSFAAGDAQGGVQFSSGVACYSPEANIGVGSVVCSLNGLEVEMHQSAGLIVDDLDSRVCFPAWTESLAGRAFGMLLGNADASKQVKLHFLFTGAAPVRLQIHGARTNTLTIATEPRRFRRQLNQWWRAIQNQAKSRSRHDGLAYLDTFLVNTLGRQLNLSPRRRASETGWKPSKALELLTGSNGLRKQALLEVVSGVEPESTANLPLPSRIAWQARSVPKAEAVEIEPIARFVPNDCLYVRFGTFSNYLWLSKLGEARADDIAKLTSPLTSKSRQGILIQQQLGVKEVPYAEMFGDQVIDDIAVVAKDLFFEDGAAFGVVFKSSSRLLSAGLVQARKAVRKEHEGRGATLKDIEIEGQLVSFLSTPDNRVRSFYLQIGECHLITNCRDIVEGFIRVKDGKGSLAEDAEFQLAHEQLLEKQTVANQKVDGVVFVYIPRLCLENITSPDYQIELWRRTRSVAEMQAYEMAMQLAEHQSRINWPLPAVSGGNEMPQRIIAQGILPSGFQQHAGSGDLSKSKAGMLDSLRGNRGTFVPIPDIEVRSATHTESRRYHEFSSYLLERTPMLPPIAVTLARSTTQNGNATLAFRMHIAPFDRTKYDFLRFFVGDASREFLVPGPNALASVSILSQDFTGRAGGQDDFSVVTLVNQPADMAAASRSLIKELGKWKAYPVYCVSTLSLKRFPLIGAMADETVRVVDGLQRLPFGLYRKAGLELTAISFQPELLNGLPDEFQMQQAAEPAHLRMRVGNIAKSALGPSVLDGLKSTAEERSKSNAKFLNTLSQQLMTSPSESWKIAHDVMGSPLRCPMGGTYQLSTDKKRWVSSRWIFPSTVKAKGKGARSSLAGAKAPSDPKVQTSGGELNPLAWMQSVELNVGFTANRIVGYGHVEFAAKEKTKAEEKSSIFNLFRSS